MKSIAHLCGAALVLTFWIAGIAAWATHVIACIKTGAWVLLFIGAIIFPIAVVHGVGIWFGVL